MKAYVSGNTDYGVILLFCDTRNQAKAMAASEIDLEYFEVNFCKRAPEVDYLFKKYGYGTITDSKVMRESGRITGEIGGSFCDSCGLGDFENLSESHVCIYCFNCKGCGHDDDCVSQES